MAVDRQSKIRAAPTPRWEYTTIWIRTGAQKGKWGKDDDFNRLGAEGWELVGIFTERAIFKRQLPAT